MSKQSAATHFDRCLADGSAVSGEFDDEAIKGLAASKERSPSPAGQLHSALPHDANQPLSERACQTQQHADADPVPLQISPAARPMATASAVIPALPLPEQENMPPQHKAGKRPIENLTTIEQVSTLSISTETAPPPPPPPPGCLDLLPLHLPDGSRTSPSVLDGLQCSIASVQLQCPVIW